MKLYKSENLFIAKAGSTYESIENGTKHLNIKTTGYIIIKPYPYNDYTYIDIFSKETYTSFHHYMCDYRDRAVLHPIKLYSFITNNFEEFEKYPIIEKISYKIINGHLITNTDINILLFFLNNRKEFEKKYIEYGKKVEKNIYNEARLNNNIYTDITKNNYKLEPGIKRNTEINDLMISLAGDKSTILIGNEGVGKSNIIDELVYKIQNNDVPNFLKKQKIYELNLANLDLYKKQNNGIFEDKLITLIAQAIKHDIILFIDNLHDIYKYDIANVIIESINKKGLKVIGITTTDEYNKIINNDESIKEFEKIFIHEPNDETLYQIINKVFNDYSKNNKIKLFDNLDYVIDLLIDLTKEENRIWNSDSKFSNDNIIYNPELVIQIIDKIFAHAKFNNQKKLEPDNIKYAINACNSIMDNKKEETLKKVDVNEEELKKNFVKYLKPTNM